MGRAMIIICAGVLVSVGYVGFGSSQQMKQVTGSNASYAEMQKAKNAAYTTIQMAMREMDFDTDLGHDDTHDGINDHDDSWMGRKYHDSGNPWMKNVEDSEVELWIDVIYEETDPDLYFNPDTIRVVSTANYFDPVSEDDRSKKLINTYITSAIDQYVPDFEGALTFTGNAEVYTNGSASISGNDASGTCEDKPGVAVANPSMQDHVEENTSSIPVEGGVSVVDDLDYDPTAEMIARLAATDDVTYISGNYSGAFGTAEEPGVFFVEDNAKMTGSAEEGFGILVIRSDGGLSMEDEDGSELSVAANFEFNGLVIFENAYNFDGKGTPTINGSVLVGNTDDYDGDDLYVDLNGNINLQYDCQAERYAKMAAAKAVNFKRYVRISTFE